MPHLTHRDYDALLAGLRELYACPSIADYPATALAVCRRLIRGDISAYTEIDARANRSWAVFDSPDSTTATEALEPAWQAHFHEHPVLRYHEGTSVPGVRSIGDLLSLARWKKTPLYNEFYRRLDALEQLVVPAPQRDGLIIGVAINRDQRSFSRRDRLVGALVREHLFQVHAHLTALETLRQQVCDLEGWYSRCGVALLIINDRSRIVYCSAATAELIQLHMDWPAGAFATLPAQLLPWTREQINVIRRRDRALAPPESLVIEGEAGKLIVQLVPDRDPARFVILLREEAAPRLLCRLGLTERQAEVLHWVALGKTNAEVGARLSISPRTVHKHLERIFEKLGVTSRTEAAVLATQPLRFM